MDEKIFYAGERRDKKGHGGRDSGWNLPLAWKLGECGARLRDHRSTKGVNFSLDASKGCLDGTQSAIEAVDVCLQAPHALLDGSHSCFHAGVTRTAASSSKTTVSLCWEWIYIAVRSPPLGHD
jgi:hypothetical protein